jgi:hypothetical protein
LETDAEQKIKQLAQKASGRCNSCLHSRAFHLPSGNRYWCRAFNAELTEEEHRGVRNCPRWSAFIPARNKRIDKNLVFNPLIQAMVEAEDLLFWRLKYHLTKLELDLKTIIVIAHPGTIASRDLIWIDSLNERFENKDPLDFEIVLKELKRLEYLNLAELVERIYAVYINKRQPQDNSNEEKKSEC